MNMLATPINEYLEFFTDAATLAVFDTAVLKSRVNDDIDWCVVSSFSALTEVAEGLIALISLGGDGFYSVRVTSGSLTDDEKDFAREVTGPLGIVSESGTIFIGKGECLPGGGENRQAVFQEHGSGKFISLAPGNYEITAYSIVYPGAGEPKVKLPDIVIIIKQRSAVCAGINAQPRLFYDTANFLFPSTRNTRMKKPRVGLTLEAKVWKTTRTASGLALKENRGYGKGWPESYRKYEVVLEDMSLIEWSDIILIKTKRVDEENKLIIAELIEKLGKTQN